MRISYLTSLVLALMVGCAPATARPAATVPMRVTLTPGEPALVLATVPPASTATFEPTMSPTPSKEVGSATFTVVYDNNVCDATARQLLRTSWGFACWIEAGDTTILFDTGGDGATLLHNLRRLGLDPLTIDAVVLSHAHGDHTGGLRALLADGARPRVYVPASFSDSFKREVRAYTDVVEVSASTVVAPGVHTTGPTGTGVIEQALAVQTREGLVVVTGCAHPGVVKMVRGTKERFDGRIALVLGGFHLGEAGRPSIEGIIADLRNMGVQRVAPCHCTGDEARRLFGAAFGDNCILAGAGWSIEFRSGAGEQ